jgi:hypothetical protein
MHENLEIVLASGRHFDEQDWAALAEILHPGVVSHWPEDWPETGVFVGRDTVVRHFRRLREDWAYSSLSAEATADKGDWVAVRWRQVFELRRRDTEDAATGTTDELRISAAYRVEGRQIADIRFGWSHAEILALVGLPG